MTRQLVPAVRNLLATKNRRGVFVAFALRTVATLGMFGLHVAVARAVGEQGYGSFAYTLTLLTVLGPIAGLGWPSAVTRFAAQFAASEQWDQLRGAIRRAQQVAFGGASVIAAGLVAGAALTATSGIKTSLTFAGLLVPLQAVGLVQSRIQQGLRNVVASIVTLDVALPILTAAAILVHHPTGIKAVLTEYSIVFVLVIAASFAFLAAMLPRNVKQAQPAFETARWMKISTTMLLGTAGQLVMNRSDILVLGWLASLGAVGGYGAALRLAALPVFAMYAVTTMSTPMLAGAYQQRDVARFRQILIRATLACAIGALPVYAMLVAAPKMLLGLFGSDFRVASKLLVLLATGQFIDAATGPMSFALLMASRERQFATSVSIVAVSKVLLIILAFHRWGVISVAVINLLSVIALNVWQFRLVLQIGDKEPTGAPQQRTAQSMANS